MGIRRPGTVARNTAGRGWRYPQPIWPLPAASVSCRGMANVRVLVLLLALVVPGLALPGLARADIYRYVDADGVEHYTNIQPSGRGWQRVVKTGSGSAVRGRGGRAGGGAVRAPDPE